MSKNYTDLIKLMIQEQVLEKKDQDYDVKECKVCKVRKRRFFAGLFDSNNRKYTDEEGTLWNGRVCPDCHKKQMASQQAKKRSKNRSDGDKPSDI